MINYQLINRTEAFVFPEGSELTYPLPPLVTAENLGNGILVRAVVFIDANFEGTPSFGQWIYNADEKSLKGVVDYDAPAPQGIPTSYQAWMVEATYETSDVVETIILYLCDTDPKTSRGTVTTVQTGLD